jgi:uncharacterized protein (DUF1015 family)
MTRTEELWNEIKDEILAEDLISQKQIDFLQQRVLSKKVTIEDWNLAIENTVLKDDDNGE